MAVRRRSSSDARVLPTLSYLEKYLPRVYQENPSSASFLDRFLANFEGIYTTIEDRIAAVQCRFDPQTAPAGDLEYLASWIGVALDASWDESKQRIFLRTRCSSSALAGHGAAS